jgi:HigB_toxin, RelE-like toxic component of a toxin-antitoxin system
MESPRTRTSTQKPNPRTGWGWRATLNAIFFLSQHQHLTGLGRFDVGGNKYRIIARVIYKLKTVFIRNVFTHDEYNSWKAEDDPWSKKGQQAQISKQKKLKGGNR